MCSTCVFETTSPVSKFLITPGGGSSTDKPPPSGGAAPALPAAMRSVSAICGSAIGHTQLPASTWLAPPAAVAATLALLGDAVDLLELVPEDEEPGQKSMP